MDNHTPTNSQCLKDFDQELYQIIKKEEYRQFSGIELIASENYTSQAVFDCLGKFYCNFKRFMFN